MILSYAQDGYLMAKMTPSADVVVDGKSAVPVAGTSAGINKAGMDDLRGAWTSPARDQGEP